MLYQLIGNAGVCGVDIHGVRIAEARVTGGRDRDDTGTLSFDLPEVVVQLNEGFLDSVTVALVRVVGGGGRLHVRDPGQIVLVQALLQVICPVLSVPASTFCPHFEVRNNHAKQSVSLTQDPDLFFGLDF